MLELFQAGRLNKAIPEHLDLIKRWLAYFKDQPEYVKFAEMYNLAELPVAPSIQSLPEAPTPVVEVVAPIPELPSPDPVVVPSEVIDVPAIPDSLLGEDRPQGDKDIDEEASLDKVIEEKGIKVHHLAGLVKKREAVKNFLLSNL